ncbi:MAG: TonB-dependent receptor [Cytophagales bacterium]|nr:TonB-dependent receptor [Cytophagales bacterium]
MKKILLICFMLLAALIIDARAQDRTITGKVLDENGSSLPGVNIILKGTAIGTTSDIDGNYVLSLPSEGGVLIFSFIGFATREIDIGSQSTINVTLLGDTRQLSEVVVTGYGVQEKRSLTGSIASVKGEVIENLPMQSFDRAIQGRAAGVQVTSTSGAPGGAINVRIRGVGSITGGNDPLYVVDGVQVNSGDNNTFGSGNALNSINPNDIESIEVLKDASAAAIYGAQAANGVVLITTKRGKAGKTRINFTAQVGETAPINLIDALNTSQFKTLRAEALTNRFGPNYDPDGQGRTTAQYVQDLYGNQDTDWVDEAFRNGTNQTYDISFDGGNERTNFFISGSYNLQEGIVLASDFERGTGRFNLNHKINDKLSIEQKISLARTTQNGTISDGAFISSIHLASLFMAPNEPVRDEAGEYNQDLPQPWNFNIVQMADFDERVSDNTQIVGSFAVNYQILPNLKLRGFIGVDYSGMEEYAWSDPRINNYRNFGNGIGGRRSERRRNIISWNTNETLTYSKSFGDHTINALVGFEYRQLEWENLTAIGEGFNNFRLRTLASAAGPGTAVSNPVNSFNTSWNMASFFGNVNYDYKKRYFATATLRRDGSSRFGVDNRWGNFYSGSVGWAISEESFMDDIAVIDNLKIRASYGQTGNSLLNPNGTENFVAAQAWGVVGNYTGEGGTLQNGFLPVTLGNNRLTWEVAEQANIGLDFALFGGRISGAVDAYITETSSLLLDRSLPTDTGWGSVKENVGIVENKGLEIELSTVNIDAGNFKWTTDFNISFQENQVKELFAGNDTVVLASGEYLIVGNSLRSNRSPTYLGVNPANGKAMWEDADGNITYLLQDEDNRIQGNRLSDFFGGLTNTITYKGFTLDVFFQFDYGRQILNNNAFFHEASGGYIWNQAVSQLDRWQNPGDITHVPRPYDGVAEPGDSRSNQFSTRQLEDASYIRLKAATLSYDFPNTIVSKIGLYRARVFAQGINLWTLTEYTGWDPELLQTDLGRYPQAKQYTLGVQIGL